MSAFAADWLRRREPHDHQARALGLTRAFAAALGPAPSLVDLGTGTGSNLRYLAPRLPAGQRWRCLDHDPALLALAQAEAPAGVAATFEPCDLAKDLADLPLPEGTALTASALLDLASAAWLDLLAARCRGRPLLIALSVDGRLVWTPEHPFDHAVAQAFNEHQRQDKGFGPALGGDAVRYLGRRLNAGGHRVSLAHSDWRLGPDAVDLLAPLQAGIAAAAAEVLGHPPALADWQAQRAAELAAGRLALQVGHLDLLALP